ncbi:MAG: type I restriction-modification system subunit M N-terminal domain-containing protein, partial [Flavobacteriales bacterium]
TVLDLRQLPPSTRLTDEVFDLFSRPTMTSKQRLEATLWDIANTLRGKMAADDFRDYILGFIILQVPRREDAPLQIRF